MRRHEKRFLDQDNLVEVEVKVNGVVGRAMVRSIDEQHVCGSFGFGMRVGDVCLRCDAERRAMADALSKAKTI